MILDAPEAGLETVTFPTLDSSPDSLAVAEIVNEPSPVPEVVLTVSQDTSLVTAQLAVDSTSIVVEAAADSMSQEVLDVASNICNC